MGRPKKETTDSITNHVEVKQTESRDELLIGLATLLNKENKDGGKIAHFLDEYDDPAMISDWVSTGSSMLDLAISNRPHGGLPCGRAIEISGLESTGKSLISAHICAETQKKGGRAIVIDTESSAAPEFWKSLGVNFNQLLYVHKETVEEIFEMIESGVAYIRKNNKDEILTIIVDSIAGASTKKELESDHGVDGFNTGKAIIVSKAMRKITQMIAKQKVLLVFTNQLRQNLQAMAFSDPYVTSGGKALAYHCSVRVRLKTVSKLKNEVEDVIGNECEANVLKNRMGPPFRKAKFDIYYDSGIADYPSWVDVLKKRGLATQSGPVLKFANGDTYKSADLVQKLNTDPVFKESIYKQICDAVIMKYKTPNSEIKDVIVDAGENDKPEVKEIEE